MEAACKSFVKTLGVPDGMQIFGQVQRASCSALRGVVGKQHEARRIARNECLYCARCCPLGCVWCVLGVWWLFVAIGVDGRA